MIFGGRVAPELLLVKILTAEVSAGVCNAEIGKLCNIFTPLNDNGNGLHNVSPGTND
jgi:hypothetical protein